MSRENSKNRRTWTASEKLRVVQEGSNLTDDELGAFLRREGLHADQLQGWIEVANAAALASFAPKKRSRNKRSPEEQKIHALEKELKRKEKALAEVTAILVLKKKVQEIWGDEDDDTDMRSES